jgi:cytochrome c-type biogenesis protein CcmH/NrfG
MSTSFWFAAGTLTGICAALIAFPILRGALTLFEHRKIRIAASLLGVIAFATTAVVLYRTLGRPDLLETRVARAPAAHPGMGAPGADGPADSMEDVVTRLEARIARDGGKPEDWQLLAQSYEFMGRADDARHARERAGNANASAPKAESPPVIAAQPAAPVEVSAAEYEKRARENPQDVEGWRALTSVYRRQHDYAKARDAFSKLVRLKAMDADAWADYADVLASVSGGSLRGEPAKAIDAALRIDPLHAKALWLKASLAHEEHRYSDALKTWKQLRAALPANSPDTRVVDANIGEAAQLAGLPAEASVPKAAIAQPAAALAAAVEVTGTVSVDSRLMARVPAGATLFIYAKAADSPGPPLAVLRQVAGSWPVTFRLDDTLAMIPSRRLSQFERVIVEARISRSGQATPAAGDLYVKSAVLKPGERKQLALVIDHEVG